MEHEFFALYNWFRVPQSDEVCGPLRKVNSSLSEGFAGDSNQSLSLAKRYSFERFSIFADERGLYWTLKLKAAYFSNHIMWNNGTFLGISLFLF